MSETDQTNDAVGVVMKALAAVEERRIEELAGLYHPEIQFFWPPGLPYSGRHRGLGEIMAMSAAFEQLWGPLQPDAETRRMTPELVAAHGEDVVVRYVWRAVDPQGARLAADTLAHYKVRGGRLIQAKMYYFDLAGLLDFVADAC